MCGRFSLSKPDAAARRYADEAAIAALTADGSLRPRYNIAPGQLIAAVRAREGARTQSREVVMLKWGLVPFWAKDADIGNRLANARAETASEKPSFRQAFRARRCIILADGFYEWRTGSARKQPFFIRRTGGAPIAMAGLWERWTRGEEPLETCTILTTDANALMKPIHHRMPVILADDDVGAWLAEPRQELLAPCPPDALEAWPVSTLVNAPSHDVPECTLPATADDAER